MTDLTNRTEEVEAEIVELVATMTLTSVLFSFSLVLLNLGIFSFICFFFSSDAGIILINKF